MNKLENIKCLRCKSREIVKRGVRESKRFGKNQRYGCKNCGFRFSVYESLWRIGRYEKQIINNKGNKKIIEFRLTPLERISKITFPNRISGDLAYFCGVLAGDGSIRFQASKKQYEIHCAGNPKDEKEFYNETISPIIKKLFNLDVKPKYLSSGKVYGIDICSKNLVKYLTEFIGLPLGKKYEKLCIPKIFLSDKKLVYNFISGLADTDFHLRIKRGYYPIIIGVSKSKRFIEEIKDFLEKEGFKCSSYERRYNDKRINKIITTYSLELSGYKQFIPWLQKINFRHPKTVNKIKILTDYYRKRE